MARKTVTTYVCDACEQSVERPKDLKKFALQLVNPRGWPVRISRTDLCKACEGKMLVTVASFFPDSEQETITEMNRETKETA